MDSPPGRLLVLQIAAQGVADWLALFETIHRRLKRPGSVLSLDLLISLGREMFRELVVLVDIICRPNMGSPLQGEHAGQRGALLSVS